MLTVRASKRQVNACALLLTCPYMWQMTSSQTDVFMMHAACQEMCLLIVSG